MPYTFNPFTGKLDYYTAGGGIGPRGLMGMMGMDGEDGQDGMPLPGPAGPNGTPGTPGTNGQNALPIALDGIDGDEGMPIPGPMGPQGIPGVTTTTTTFIYLDPDLPDDPLVIPGPSGSNGTNGTTGAVGPTGPAVYLEAPEADEPMVIPGPPGTQGTNGTTGAQGPQGPAIFLEAFDGEDGQVGPPGLPGPAGVNGTTGAQGPTGPAVYLEAAEAEDQMVYPGPPGAAGANGTTGVQGPVGPAPHFTIDTCEVDVMNEALSAAAGSYYNPNTGIVNTAGGLTALTTIASTVTPTTGGITLTLQTAAVGSVWRVKAHGTFVAVSSATARNALCAAFWGATSLTVLTVGAVLVSTAQTTNWELEMILTASSTTAVWTTGYCNNRVASTTLVATSGITPASTTVTAGAQTIDLRFYSSVAVASDSWSIQQVTIERIK